MASEWPPPIFPVPFHTISHPAYLSIHHRIAAIVLHTLLFSPRFYFPFALFTVFLAPRAMVYIILLSSTRDHSPQPASVETFR